MAGANQYAAQGITLVKEYLENAKNPDAVPFSSTMQVEWDCSLMSLFQFFDEHGKYRAQIASMVGPEATVPKQVERFHAEMLEHIEAVLSLRTSYIRNHT